MHFMKKKKLYSKTIFTPNFDWTLPCTSGVQGDISDFLQTILTYYLDSIT